MLDTEVFTAIGIAEIIDPLTWPPTPPQRPPSPHHRRPTSHPWSVTNRPGLTHHKLDRNRHTPWVSAR